MLRYSVILFSLLTLAKSQFEDIIFVGTPEGPPGAIEVKVALNNYFAKTSLKDIRFLNESSPLVETSDIDTVLTITAPVDGYIEFPEEFVDNFTTFEAINIEGENTTDCRITGQIIEGFLLKMDIVDSACSSLTIGAASISELDAIFSAVVIGFPGSNTSIFHNFWQVNTAAQVNLTVVGRDIFDDEIQLIQTLKLIRRWTDPELYTVIAVFLLVLSGVQYCLERTTIACKDCIEESYNDCNSPGSSCYCPCSEKQDSDMNTSESRSVTSSTSRVPQEEVPSVDIVEYMNRNRPYGISLPQAELASQYSESVIDLAETVSRISGSRRYSELPMAERYQGYMLDI